MTFPTELERLLKEATDGPWEIYDSCSWRRIGLAGTYKEILWPSNSPSDGHPDLSGVNRDADLSLLIYLRNHADAILGLVRAAERAREHAAHKKEADKETDDLMRAGILGGMVISIEEELRPAMEALNRAPDLSR